MNPFALEYVARARTLELIREADVARPALAARPAAFRLPSFRIPLVVRPASRTQAVPCPTC